MPRLSTSHWKFFPIAIIFALLFLAGCKNREGDGVSPDSSLSGQKTFESTDITGVNYGKNFSLTDHSGHIRNLNDFKGKIVVIFFGYTQCPDVCPTTMLEMANVMKQLGNLADQVQVLFITLDPERDSTQRLSQYVPSFDKRFIGLSGTKESIDEVAKEFKVFHQKVPAQTAGNYSIDHTAGMYVFDTQGRLRLFVNPTVGSAALIHDIKLLLSNSSSR